MQHARAVTKAGEPHHTSDAELLAAATTRNQQAFTTLMQRHFAVVYRVVWRMSNGHADAEDITQEAFLRLWKDPSQVREAAALRGWLVRVANNLVMDRFRKPNGSALDAILEPADGRADAEAQLQQREGATAVDQAIAELPERQRLALTLVHFEQMTNQAAADALAISVDALESLLSRARRNLKERLQPHKQSLLAALAAEGT